MAGGVGRRGIRSIVAAIVRWASPPNPCRSRRAAISGAPAAGMVSHPGHDSLQPRPRARGSNPFPLHRTSNVRRPVVSTTATDGPFSFGGAMERCVVGLRVPTRLPLPVSCIAQCRLGTGWLQDKRQRASPSQDTSAFGKDFLSRNALHFAGLVVAPK